MAVIHGPGTRSLSWTAISVHSTFQVFNSIHLGGGKKAERVMLNCGGNEINPRERGGVLFLPSGHGLSVHANLTGGISRPGSVEVHFVLPGPL